MDELIDYVNVAEDEVIESLESLRLTPSPGNICNNNNATAACLNTQQLARRGELLKKKYNKKHHFAFSVKQKIAIVQEAVESNNIRSTALSHKILPCQIRAWRSQIDDLKLKVLLNPNAKTTHSGRAVEFFELENKVHKWVEEM